MISSMATAPLDVGVGVGDGMAIGTVTARPSASSITVTASDVNPTDGAVYVNGTPEVGTSVETEPFKADADRVADEFVRVAVIGKVPPADTTADVGTTVSVGAATWMVIKHGADRPSVASITVTVSEEKPLAGAVYVKATPEVTDPDTVPCKADAVSDADELTSVGMSARVPPGCTMADDGETVNPGDDVVLEPQSLNACIAGDTSNREKSVV